MPTNKNFIVVDSFENEDRNKCVDIIQTKVGKFLFQEWRREPEDLHGWFLLGDSSPHAFASQLEATSAACQAIIWLNVIVSKKSNQSIVN
jgi:hypothetical protein